MLFCRPEFRDPRGPDIFNLPMYVLLCCSAGQDLETLKTSTLLQDHALRVMSTVDSVVMLIDDRRALAKNLRDLGSVHRTYNVPYDMFQVICNENLRQCMHNTYIHSFICFIW